MNPVTGDLGILFYDRSADPEGKTMNVTLATGFPSDFELETITTAPSQLSGDLWLSENLPNCQHCVYHVGEYASNTKSRPVQVCPSSVEDHGEADPLPATGTWPDGARLVRRDHVNSQFLLPPEPGPLADLTGDGFTDPFAHTEPDGKPGGRILADDVCTAIDPATIDAILGLHVGEGVPTPASCSWMSQHPPGSLTLARLTEAQVRQQITTLTKTEPKVAGIGIRAFGFSQGGLPAPNPRSGAELTVDFGTYGLYENLSGPAVRVEDAVRIARLVSTPS